jgi:hypothetical protein
MTAAELSASLRSPAGRPAAIEAIRAAVDAADGEIVSAARHLGVSHGTLCHWRRVFPSVAAVVVEAVEVARASGRLGEALHRRTAHARAARQKRASGPRSAAGG